jgi:mannose-6-phosphate isomerase-like protein (cupin superfamily)
MKVIKNLEYTGNKAWESMPIAKMNGITINLHWTDEPYHWHINDGEEVFVVLSGAVEMNYKDNHEINKILLQPGDIFYAEIGCEHVAYPQGEARILVIEKEGSV